MEFGAGSRPISGKCHRPPMRFALPFLALAVGGFACADDELPKGGGNIQMVLAKIEGDQFIVTTETKQTRRVIVAEKDGDEIKTKTIDVTETISNSVSRDLKNLKATGPDDKEMTVEEFKAHFKGGSTGVFLTAPLDPSWKKKFKRGTVFVEYAAPKEAPKKDSPKKDG